MPTVASAATVIVFNGDAPGEGFNDPTPAAPIGGNLGTTVGAQRLIAFQHAAAIWGQTLTSTRPIRILAFFDPLPCTATSAALGAAAPLASVANVDADPGFPGMTTDTWYPVALAEKLTDVPIMDLILPTFPFQAFAFFTSQIGQLGCLPTLGWYYGLDTNTPVSRINLVTVLLHEFGHGLGFTAGPTNANTGARVPPAPGLEGYPSIWESSMGDLSLGKKWLHMTDVERAFSARNNLNLVWQGTTTTAAVPTTLGPGTELFVQGAPSIEGAYQAEPASFGPRLPGGGVKAVLTAAVDGAGPSSTDGCEPIISDVAGRIALVDRGNCTFPVKALNAQTAGAVGLVIANNIPGLFPAVGADLAVVIPVVSITQQAGNTLRAVPQLSNNGDGGVPVRLQSSTVFRAGTTAGFARLYAPGVFQQGSSVSHFDVTMTPNMLMEPAINRDLTHAVTPPTDLTFLLLLDIGW